MGLWPWLDEHSYVQWSFLFVRHELTQDLHKILPEQNSPKLHHFLTSQPWQQSLAPTRNCSLLAPMNVFSAISSTRLWHAAIASNCPLVIRQLLEYRLRIVNRHNFSRFQLAQEQCGGHARQRSLSPRRACLQRYEVGLFVSFLKQLKLRNTPKSIGNTVWNRRHPLLNSRIWLNSNGKKILKEV